MKKRTLEIFAELIENFISGGRPIASKKILRSGKFEISSATIRNEFAILEEIGLIFSPHISAGKVPTEKGFRFFVDEILAEKDEQIFKNIVEKKVKKYKFQKSKESALEILRMIAQISQNVAFVNFDDDRSFYLGISNILRQPEFFENPEKIAQIVEIFEGREKFRNFLNSIKFGSAPKIFIGRENLLAEISSCAMIVTNFTTKNSRGKIGILGPIRMNYAQNRALLQIAQKMIL